MAPAVALNVTELDPAATVTEAGIVSRALLVESATAAPPTGAAAVKVTVQTLVAEDPRLEGLHWREDSDVVGGCQPCTVMAPPVPVTVEALPSGKTPTRFPIERGIDALLVDDGRVTVTTATAPVLIGLAFRPMARHVADPLTMLQFKVLPAAVSAAPGAMLTEATSPAA